VAIPAFAQDNFPDVPTDPPHWAAKALEEMKREGVLVGYPDGLYRGGRPASRYELAVAVNAAYQKLKAMNDGLAAQIKALEDKMGTGMNADEIKALRDQLESLRNDMNAMKGWGDDIAKLKEMASTFEKELASMGVDVEQMKKDLSDLADRVGKLEKRKPAVDIGGDANLLLLAGHGTSGNYGLTPDGRLLGVGRGSYADQIGAGMTRDLSIFHEAAFTLRGTNDEGPKWNATVVVGNMLSGGAFDNGAGIPVNGLGNQNRGALGFTGPVGPNGTGFAESNSDVYVQNFGVMFDTSVAGLAFSAEVGRIGYQISPYMFKRPDYTTYFSNPRWDNGDWYFDGALLKFKFGGAAVHVFGGRNSDRLSVNGTDLNNMGLFNAATNLTVGPIVPGAMGPSMVDQSLGVRLNIPISDMGQVNLAYLWLDSNNRSTAINTTTGAILGEVNRLNVYGGDVTLRLGVVDFSGGVSKSTYTRNTSNVLDSNNTAWFANGAYSAGNWGVNGGYRRVERNYGAPGFWGRIGTYWNPANVEGFNAGGWINVSPDFRLSARGEFDQEIDNLVGGVSGDRSRLNSFTVQADYKFTNNWNLMASYEDVRFEAPGFYAGGIRAVSKQRWFTVGLGYMLGANAKLDFTYMNSDIKGDVNNFYPGLRSFDFRGGLLSTQLSIKF
jgi:hypothetical protein